MIKIYIEEDDSGHEYIIPSKIIRDFSDLKEKISETESYSDLWYELIEEFKEKFSKYREYSTNTELWVTEEELKRITG